MAHHYLDYAATTAVRPEAVSHAVYQFLRETGASPGRGSHRLASQAGRIAIKCRQGVIRALGLPDDPTRVAFTQNATQALNMALFGILRCGDSVVATQYDHNSVLRPLHLLGLRKDVETRMVRGAPDGSLDLEDFRAHLRGARLVVVNAVSNVLGTRLPVRELAQAAREEGALVLVDAAQWAGHITESLAELGADVVAFTGHKGLLGPQGIGGLWVREGLEFDPLFAGGTGGNSDNRAMPSGLPERLEAGTGNSRGMAGLLAGIEFLLAHGIETIHRRAMGLKALLREGLEGLPSVRVLSPPGEEGVGIVTFVSYRVDPATVAEKLDRDWGVLVSHGLNCAPEVHRILGTSQTGAVRLSVGWASTIDDVTQAIRGVEAITGAPVRTRFLRSPSMRLFLAVNIPKKEKDRIHRASRMLRDQGFPFRWVEPDLFHLTLKFLGAVRTGKKPKLEKMMEDVGSPPARSQWTSEDSVPSRPLRRPRVLWVGVDPSPALRCLKQDIEWGLSEYGFQRETRAFHPHFTLGRAITDGGAGAFRGLDGLAADLAYSGRVEVRKFDLMESHLSPSGPRYVVLSSFPLKGPQGR